MKRLFSFLLKLLIVIGVAILSIVVLVFSINSEKVPDIIVFADAKRVATAVKGNYKWNAFSEVIRETRFYKEIYSFTTDNTLLVTPEEVFTIANSQSIATRRNFKVDNIYYEDSNGVPYNVPLPSSSTTYSDMNYAEFTAPTNDGTYFYYFKLNYFEKGEVEYAFKVVVSSEVTYDIQELVKYKNTALVDVESIDAIIKILPHSRNKKNITIQNSSDSQKLILNYSEIALDRGSFVNNVIAIFALIPEVDIVEYKSPDMTYTYTRKEIELRYERELTDYAQNPDLWETEVFYGDRQLDSYSMLHTLFSKIILDSLDIASGENVKTITINTDSFSDNTFFDVNYVTKELILSDLCDTFENIYDMTYENYKEINLKHPYVEAESLIPQVDPNQAEGVSGDTSKEAESGDNPLNINDNEIRIVVRQNGKETRYLYKCFYVNSKWMFYKENI